LRQGAARFILSAMAHADSVLDHEAMAYAKGLLKAPLEKDSLLAALAAALFAAVSALAFAVAMVMAPPVTTSRLALEPGPASAEVVSASENN
jgi:hypothetical protein